MIPAYNLDDITGGLDNVFENVMKVGFVTSLILFSIWIVLSLIIWSFRSQKKI